MAPKRAAPKAIKATPPMKAARKEDPMLAAVVEALERSAELSADCAQMLIAGARHSLSLCSEERHESHALVVKFIEDTLQASQKSLQAKLASEEDSAASADAEKRRLAEVIVKAKDSADVAADKVLGEENALAAQTDILMAARSALDEIVSANKEADKKRRELISEEQDLGKVIDEHFNPIEAGELESEVATAHADALLKVAESLGLDEVLRVALPKSCSKKKAERGPFDDMVIEQLGMSLRSQHKQLMDMVAAAGPAPEARTAEEEKRATVAAAEKAQQEAATSLSIARTAMDQETKALQKAKEAAKAYEQEFSSATTGRDDAKTALESFTKYTLECFTTLKTKERPKPVEKPLEVPLEEVVTEEAGADAS